MLVVPEQMAAMLRWYETDAASLHPVERAARLHSDFVKIHPFVDGNGRTARTLLNLELLGIRLPRHRPAGRAPLGLLRSALDKAHVDGDLSDFVALVARCVREDLHRIGICWVLTRQIENRGVSNAKTRMYFEG